MLNINKIESDINFNNLESKDISNILELKYTTTLDRRKKGNWTPNDIEKLADYFGRTIAYYFDREEKQQVAALEIPGATQVIVKPYAQPKPSYKHIEQQNIGTESKMTFYSCPECVQKEEKIRDLKANINDLRKHIDLLESIVEKKNQQKASG